LRTAGERGRQVVRRGGLPGGQALVACHTGAGSRSEPTRALGSRPASRHPDSV